MKKTKKLLSVVLAMVMMFSCFSIIGAAYEEYETPNSKYYDSVDLPRAYLYSTEQRYSYLADMLNEILAGANIKISTKVLSIITISIDATSLDAIFDSFDGLSGYLDYLGFLLGDLGDLDFSLLCDADKSIYNNGGARDVFDTLIRFLNTNADKLGDIIESGTVDLGLIGNFVDISAIGDILGDLPGLISGLIYGLGKRQISNGIGNDPKYPNSTLWDELEDAQKPNFDAIAQNLIYKLLVEPNRITKATKVEDNEILSNPEKFGATADLLHVQTLDDNGNKIYDEDGNEANWWYIYGTQKSDGSWVFTKETTTEDDSDKHYVGCWDENTALVKGVAGEQLKEILNLSSGDDLYTMLEKAIPWAYDTFGGHNLDGQLRATLMQFCGAFNNGDSDKLTDEVKAQLKAIMDGYKAQEDKAKSDKKVLRDVFASELGRAGNYNFMYIDLEGKDINDKTSDSLYYVVEWGGSYQYYHVERGDVSPFYDLINWEYQAPMWSEIMAKTSWTSGTSILQHINVIVGEILKSAIPTLEWTAGTANGTLAANVTALVKLVIKTDTVKLFGEGFTLPADFDSFGLERVLVMIAGKILDDLMPQLIIPASATSVEEVLVYALREFMAEILPHLGAGWDTKITAAEKLTGSAKEDAFLDIALNMGVSAGAYYLQNLIGLGTSGGNGSTTVDANVPMGADYEWRYILNYIVDWVIATFVPNLTSNLGISGTDPLLKLSAVFSKLFPSLVKLVGASDSTYALNLNIVYGWLRAILNGDFSQFATGLLRKSSGTSGNMKLMSALATLLTELFGGLGFETQGSNWTTLKGVMDTAAASATPLTELLGAPTDNPKNADLAELLVPFIKCLAGTRTIWMDDVISLLLNFIGGLATKLTASGISTDGVENAYTGSATNKISFSMQLNTSGVRTYFNNGRYKTTAGALAGKESGFDGDYKIRYVRGWVEDASGNKKTQVTNYDNYESEPNVETSSEMELSNIPASAEVWTLVIEYKIIAPDGTVGDVSQSRQSFVVTSTTNDAMTPIWHTFTNTSDVQSNKKVLGKSHSWKLDVNVQYGYTNVYVNEYEQLSKVSDAMLVLKAANVETTSGSASKVHSYTKIWTDGYGFNIKNSDGTIKVTSDQEGNTLLDLSTVVPISLNGTALNNDQLQALWLKWGLNESQPKTGHTAGATSTAEGKFLVADEATKRSDLKDDFYTYAVTAKPVIEVDWNSLSGTFSLSQETKSWYHTSGKVAATPLTPYVIVYNSYGLEKIVESYNSLSAENYDLSTPEAKAAWTEYQDAFLYANNQLYCNWNAPTFAADHKTTTAYTYEGEEGTTTLPVGSSTFEYAGIRLEEAVEALNEFGGAVEEEKEIIDPSNPASDLYPIYTALKAADESGLKNQNYVLYRWFRYNDVRTAIRNTLNAATVPVAAQNSLVGVALDNKGIEGVINTITDADVKAIVEGLVKAPNQEAIDYANEAIENFVMPAYDVNALKSQVLEMQTGMSRLISKYDTNQYYFLNDAVTKYGNEVAANYTEGSFARYAEKLAKAQEVLAAAKNNNSTQYDIHSSRYEFLIAYNQLVKVADAADTSKIEAMYVEAQDILNKLNTADEVAVSNTEITKEEAYEQLLLAMGYPVDYKAEGATEATRYYVGGNFTAAYVHDNAGMFVAAKRQTWLNDLEANLQAALDNFKSADVAVEFLPVDGSTGDIEITVEGADGTLEKGYIYGLAVENADSKVEDIVKVTDGTGTMEVIANDKGYKNGTGAIVKTYDTNGTQVGEYVLIVFGDVDRDAAISVADAQQMTQYVEGNKGNITVDYSILAADVDHDADFSVADVQKVTQYVEGNKANVSQSK